MACEKNKIFILYNIISLQLQNKYHRVEEKVLFERIFFKIIFLTSVWGHVIGIQFSTKFYVFIGKNVYFVANYRPNTWLDNDGEKLL